MNVPQPSAICKYSTNWHNNKTLHEHNNTKTKDIPIRQQVSKRHVADGEEKNLSDLEKTGATEFSKTISMFMEVNQNGKY